MYRVLIVEDEAHAREGIQELVQLHGDEFQVQTAANGREGLDAARDWQPHIIVSDIKMPVMDGLEMIRVLVEEGCAANIILLSGYAEFQYARTAIRLGVSDYILKPIVPQTLFGLLDKCVRSIEQRQLPELPAMPLALTSEAEEEAVLAALPDSPEGYRLLVLYPAREESSGDLIGCCRSESGVVLVRLAAPGHMGAILPLDAALTAEALLECAGPGSICCHCRRADTGGLLVLMQELSKKLCWSISLGRRCFSLEECLPKGAMGGLSGTLQKKVRALFASRAYGECGQEITLTLPRFQRQGSRPEEILQWLAGCILRYPAGTLRPQNMDEEIAFAQAVSSLMSAKTTEEIVNIVEAYYQLGERARNNPTGSYSKPVSMAIWEIEKNYSLPISLTSVAAHIGITPQYLSRVFAKETGRGFSDYIIQYRIDRAKALMKQTDLKIYQIAQKIGYPDEKYFSTLFKKATGETPNSYRYSNTDK